MKSEKDIIHELNRMAPAARDAHLGDVVEDLITNYNALLAALKAANIAGLTLTGFNPISTLSAR